MHDTAILLLKYNGYHSFYMTISLFLITAVVLVAAVVTVIVVSATNAQSFNMTKTKMLTGPNMAKTANMTAGGGNMTKSDLAAYSECLRSSCDLF